MVTLALILHCKPRTFLKCNNSGLMLFFLTFGLQIFLNCLFAASLPYTGSNASLSFHIAIRYKVQMFYFIYCTLPDLSKLYINWNLSNLERSFAQAEIVPRKDCQLLVSNSKLLTFSRFLWFRFLDQWKHFGLALQKWIHMQLTHIICWYIRN